MDPQYETLRAAVIAYLDAADRLDEEMLWRGAYGCREEEARELWWQKREELEALVGR